MKLRNCLAIFLISAASLLGQITVIQPTDKVSDSRQTINDNFALIGSYGVYASGYPSMTAACAAGVTLSTTVIVSTAVSVSTLSCAANVQMVKGGVITYTGAVAFTGGFSGDLTQHLVPSGSAASISFPGPVAEIYPEWFDPAGSTDSAAAINFAIKAATGGQTVSLGAYTIGSPVIVPGNSQGVKLRSRFFQRWSSLNGGGAAPKFNLTAKTGSASFAMVKIYSSVVEYDDITVNCNNGIAVNGFLIVNGLSSVFRNMLAENCSGDGIRIDPAGGATTTSSTAITLGQVNPTVTVVTTVLEGQTIGLSTPGNAIAMIDWGTNKQEVFVVGAVVGTSVTLTGTALYAHSGTYTVQLTGNTNLMQFYNARSYGSGYVFGSGGTRVCTAGTGLAGTAAGVGWGINQYNSATNDGNANIWVSYYTSGNACGGLLITEFGNTVYGGGSEGDRGPGLQIGDSAGRDATPHNGRVGIRNIVKPLGEIEGIGTNTRGVNIACGVQNSVEIRAGDEIFNDNACSRLFDSVWGASKNAFGTGQFSALNYNSYIVLNPDSGSANGGALEFWSASPDLEVTVSACTNANPMVCTVSGSYVPETNSLRTLFGFTGAWVAANGTFTASKLSATAFSIPVDSSGFGAVTGSPKMVGAMMGRIRMNNAAMEFSAEMKALLPPFTVASAAGTGVKLSGGAAGTFGTINSVANSGSPVGLVVGANGNATGTPNSNSLNFWPSGGMSAGGTVDCGQFNGTAGFCLPTPTTPASSAAACAIGMIRFDATYFYGCTATDTWKRIAWVAF